VSRSCLSSAAEQMLSAVFHRFLKIVTQIGEHKNEIASDVSRTFLPRKKIKENE
jgi:hypothetical protein